jgi:glycosyltransferase involved in cell wall biosynthesis
MKGNVIIIGPAYPLRGGLASFDQRLARAFVEEGYECTIYSFSLQYPSFLFPGKTQYSDEPPPSDLQIKTRINSISPINWIRTGQELRNLRPDLIVVRYWLPFMAPCLGTIIRIAKKNGHSRVIAITDNVLPHEKRPGDHMLTRYFLKGCDGFVTMSEKVMQDLRKFERSKPAVQVLHPLYDNFGAAIPKIQARRYLSKSGLHIGEKEPVLLFFGFIRKYKGLDLLLEAMADPRIRGAGIKLLVAGEFYADEKYYRDLIVRLQVSEALILKTDFIPDSEVKYYLCAADAVVQPYRNATQSGVTPLAYHFEKPMIVSDVGGLPSLVPDHKAGLVTPPDPVSIAHAILHFFELGDEYFIPHLRTEKLKYSWQNLVNSITHLKNDS